VKIIDVRRCGDTLTDVSFESNLRDFQADLRALDAPAILNKYVYADHCDVLLAGQHTSLKQRIAGKFHISQADVVIVGSAKLGFSIAPEKRFREFGESSDIDVAIVSSEFYVKVWYELFNYERSGTYWEHAKEFEHYCFRGWIRPDKLPRSTVYPFSKSWWDFFQSLTSSGEFGPYKIRAALYHSKHFIDAYQRLCVDQCKQELE